MKKFTMEDVKISHSIKPYLPEKKFVKFFGFLNFKISKGWNEKRIQKYIELSLSEQR